MTMAWIAIGTAAVGTIASVSASNKASKTSREASQVAAGSQREALDYQKSVEALPLEIRDKFLPQLADIYSGGQGQQDAIDAAMASPLYQSIMGGQQVGEEAILRNASATGGLRSGNVQGALTDYGSQLQNRALMQSYNQQLQGISSLARTPLNTNAIATGTAGIGNTLAQGQIAAGQAQQAGIQSGINAITQGAGNYMQYRAMQPATQAPTPTPTRILV